MLVGYVFQFFVFFIIFTILCTPKIMEWIWDKFGTTIITVVATLILRQIMVRVSRNPPCRAPVPLHKGRAACAHVRRR